MLNLLRFSAIFHYKSTFLMRNTAKRLHKSVKNKGRNAKLHKSVIDDICIESILRLQRIREYPH
ncbi:hypothetical protein CTI18_11590 [Prevotella intermedia]|uniref:Uncharacterized protein n=1 Tax=Prevotella intermedia TaxID=28131 RepID=A0A2G8I7R2_PREIN|nr:hypothetical protein CTI18_11590 [Prevotella intermedia]